MITVKLRPGTLRQGSGLPETPSYLVPGLVNWHLSTYAHTWRPPTDVFETEDQLIIRVEIAGMDDSDFTIYVNQNTLVIHGLRHENSERKSFHQMEIHFGEFTVEVELPLPVEIENARAEYRSGFLLVIFQIAHPKHIKVEKG